MFCQKRTERTAKFDLSGVPAKPLTPADKAAATIASIENFMVMMSVDKSLARVCVVMDVVVVRSFREEDACVSVLLS